MMYYGSSTIIISFGGFEVKFRSQYDFKVTCGLDKNSNSLNLIYRKYLSRRTLINNVQILNQNFKRQRVRC